MRNPTRILAILLLPAGTLTPSLQAQESRQPLPAATASAPNRPIQASPLPPVRFVEEVRGTVLDDAPDFAPAETYRTADGRHLRTRPVGNPYVLSFATGDFTPTPGIDERLLARQRQSPSGAAYGYLMIEGRLADAKIARLQALGVQVLDFHTWQSVVARIPLAGLQVVAGLPFVRWIGLPRPSQKLGPRLTAGLEQLAEGVQTEVYVNLYEPVDDAPAPRPTFGTATSDPRTGQLLARLPTQLPDGRARRLLERAGFRPTHYHASILAFRGFATRAQIRTMQALNEVRTIERVVPDRGFHDQTMAMIGQDRVRKEHPGTRVSVGIIDSGVDLSPVHQDLTGKRFLGFRTDKSLDPFNDDHGHGTHVTGTIMGTGRADQRYIGAAPAVGRGGPGDRVFIGRYLDKNNDGVGDPVGLFDAFRLDYKESDGTVIPRPSIVNNSWGNISTGGYSGTGALSRAADDVVFERNQTYLFSAGNKSSAANWFAAEPAAAKNVLSIGATVDEILTPGATAWFSRYGTKDSRQKPEVCAPGTKVTSARFGTTDKYSSFEGTSMACPTVTGALASLIGREKGFASFPAGLKAAAVASATIDGTLARDNRRGWGQIDSYKMNYKAKTSLIVFGGTLTKSGNYSVSDLKVDKEAEAVRVVLVMIEPKASALASKARRNDVRVYMDLPPYGSSGTSGEYSLSSSHQTVMTYDSTWNGGNSFVAKAVGKTVRFRTYASSIKRLDDVKWGLAVIQYFRPPSDQKVPTLEVTPGRKIVQPKDPLILHTVLRSDPTADDMTNARIWLAGPISWKMLGITRQGLDGVLQNYWHNKTHPSSSYPRIETGPFGGMTVGTGPMRDILMTVEAPNFGGEFELRVQASFHAHNAKQTLLEKVRICVDDTPPRKIGGLSTTYPKNVWYNLDDIKFTFDQPADSGCAGIGGVYWVFSTDPTELPDEQSSKVGFNKTNVQFKPGPHQSARYFTIRAQDRAGLWGPHAQLGKFWIDTIQPILTKIVLDKDNQYTSSSTVTVGLTANDVHSGLGGVRFSLDMSTWGPWQAIQAGGNPVDLKNAAWGGSNKQGVRFVRAQVRDKAGNLSQVQVDAISYYEVPTLGQPAIHTLANVSNGYFVLKGTNLQTVDRVRFGATWISTQWTPLHDSSWAQGYFRIMDSETIRLYPPQGWPPASRNVIVHGITGNSNARLLTLTSQVQPRLYSAAKMLVNQPQTLMVTRGPYAPGTTAVIVASLSNQPSVMTGIFNFDIGNGFTSFYPLPELPFDSHGIAQVTFPAVPVLLGLTAYFQAGYLNKAKPIWPMPVSNVWSTTYVQ